MAFMKDLLAYDPSTGKLTWIRRLPRGGRPAGSKAGTIDANVYGRVRVNSRFYKTARVAWFLMTGSWPKGIVDHKDRNRANDSWSNLRLATSSQNNHNRGMDSRNVSGYKGVSWHKGEGKWRAVISVQKRSHHLGYFANKKLAAAVWKEAASRLHGEFACALS